MLRSCSLSPFFFCFFFFFLFFFLFFFFFFSSFMFAHQVDSLFDTQIILYLLDNIRTCIYLLLSLCSCTAHVRASLTMPPRAHLASLGLVKKSKYETQAENRAGNQCS
ncbi:hypothetical protein FN846DRAFT_957307 [Sphaerosporella brunnea]|uniref:Uncharacterized protein n=1 Tax=Sphaerosporella brunnea TaxID=1250544 RepID=A0A5J5ER53_9PEZI|nr:hypothetical protein FN846DRAFT_957307 [Sphaerosporella brunnea]